MDEEASERGDKLDEGEAAISKRKLVIDEALEAKKKVKLEKEENGSTASQEVKAESKEVWSGAISWKENEIVHMNNVTVQIKWATLLHKFVNSISPLIHTHLPQERAPLPIKFSLPIWGLLTQVLAYHHIIVTARAGFSDCMTLTPHFVSRTPSMGMMTSGSSWTSTMMRWSCK